MTTSAAFSTATNKYRTDPCASIASIAEAGRFARLSGRIENVRIHGKVAFLDIVDATGKAQIAVMQNHIGADQFREFCATVSKLDIITVAGNGFMTRQSQPTLQVAEWQILTKNHIKNLSSQEDRLDQILASDDTSKGLKVRADVQNDYVMQP